MIMVFEMEQLKRFELKYILIGRELFRFPETPMKIHFNCFILTSLSLVQERNYILIFGFVLVFFSSVLSSLN